MQWLTMSIPTPRTMPSRAASSTFVPTPSVERDEHRIVHRHDAPSRENTPPKLPTPLSTPVSCVRLDGRLHLLDGAGALVDVDAGRGVRREPGAERAPADVAAHLHARRSGCSAMRAYARARAAARSTAEPGDGEHPAAGDPTVGVDARRGRRSVVVPSADRAARPCGR